jgi:hypothetical protein
VVPGDTSTYVRPQLYSDSVGNIFAKNASGTISNLTSSWIPNGTALYYNSGNVGIGTTTPTTALSVIGTSTTQELNISNLANSLLAVDALGNVIATSTTNLLSDYVTYSYASSTYASTSWVTSTFLPLSASTSLTYIPLSASTSLDYVKTESDPIWMAASSSYLTILAVLMIFLF